jgi:CelD/BcsL family acetyltransferase involved in cellulose biosynthesis
VLALPSTVEEFTEGLAAHHQRNLRRAWRLLEKNGPAEIEQAETGTVGDMLQALFRLHEARWEKRHQPGVLDDARVRAFHAAAAAGLQGRGLLRLYGLRQNGEIKSVLYDLVLGDRVYAYLGGFDPALDRASPGTLLTFHAIQEAIREGCREYDFLRGAENHKYSWGARDRRNYRLLAWHDLEPERAESPLPLAETARTARGD